MAEQIILMLFRENKEKASKEYNNNPLGKVLESYQIT